MGATRLLSLNLQLLQDSILSDIAGEVNFDTKMSVMNIRNSFLGSSLQVGQEQYVVVKNTSGVTIIDGDVCRLVGYDATDDVLTIASALADKVETAEVSGIATTTMVNNAIGLITTFGRVNDLDTSGFTEGEEIFLSPTLPGKFTATKPIAVPLQVGHIGKVDATTGFIQVEIRELSPAIRAIFSDTTDQTFTANVSKALTFNTENVKEGITHSTSVDNEEITFDSGGVYVISVEPQYTRTTGGGTDVLNMYMQVDAGSGFTNIVDSNIKVAISSSGLEEVTSLTQTLKVNVGDKLRIMIQVEDADLKLDAFVGFGSGANTVPGTPSVIMNIHRIGD